MELIYLPSQVVSFLLGFITAVLTLFLITRKFDCPDFSPELGDINSKLSTALTELDLIETKLRSAESIVLITPAPVLDGTADN